MAENVRTIPALQEAADEETRRDGYGSREISFFWGRWAVGFAACIPSLQSWLVGDSPEEVRGKAEARIRTFFQEDMGLEERFSLGDMPGTGALELVSLPAIYTMRTSFYAARAALRTAQAAGILASTIEGAIPDFMQLSERAFRLVGWERRTVTARLPIYFLAHLVYDSANMRRAQNYFDQHLDELLAQFPGEYVAIIRESVVLHDRDLGEVTRRVYREYKERPIFIEKVEEPQAVAAPAMVGGTREARR